MYARESPNSSPTVNFLQHWQQPSFFNENSNYIINSEIFVMQFISTVAFRLKKNNNSFIRINMNCQSVLFVHILRICVKKMLHGTSNNFYLLLLYFEWCVCWFTILVARRPLCRLSMFRLFFFIIYIFF